MVNDEQRRAPREWWFYRAMREETPGGPPRCGTKGGLLGLRPDNPRDVCLTRDGLLRTDAGGLSGGFDPNTLPAFRRPVARGGTWRYGFFKVNPDDLPALIAAISTSPTHAALRPVEPLPLVAFQEALCATKPLWRNTREY